MRSIDNRTVIKTPSTECQDSTAVMAESGNRSISSIMKTWTEQMGFPYVTVLRNGSHFTARQDRFLKSVVPANASSPRHLWSIPLSYTTGDGSSDIIWIHDEKEVDFAVDVKNSSWVKFNVNQTGFYLVNYEKEEWLRLSDLLFTQHQGNNSSTIAKQAQFLTFQNNECSAQTRYESSIEVNGAQPCRSFPPFVRLLSAGGGWTRPAPPLSLHEPILVSRDPPHSVETAYACFVYLCQMLEDTHANALLKGYIRDLTNDLYLNLGWKTSENHLDNLLRTTIIGLACHSGNQDCLNHAAELFQNWTRGQEIPSGLRSLVYNFGMAEIGREEHWNYMWNRYLVEESPAQKKTIMNGLAHVRKPYLIRRYLEYAMDGEIVRSQDFFTILSYIAGNPVGRPLVWNFVRDKWPALVERFTLNNRYLGNVIKKICSYFTTDHQLEEMHTFFRKYPEAGAGKRRRHQALEAVQNNIKWIEGHVEGMKGWLEADGPAPWYSPRLPKHTVPEHYDIYLNPSLEAESFSGNVSIWVNVRKATNRLLVHSGTNLNISKYEVWSEAKDEDPKNMELEDEFFYEENEYLVLRTRESLPVGKYRLFFEFSGPLTLSLKGLYKSSYLNPQSKTIRFLVASQFAANYARQAFPCFDEPSFRSTFDVSISHDESLFALSNTPAGGIPLRYNSIQLYRH
ncbi:glutamyl aminopeptidase [Caerostris extrusa]|uniref:Glutamyl aminopeptidase n=1 Tax=Caerostris extrusa TaxID=172846 RepID=A0AAV4QMK2_CAEEX|nr:glutamyl aminopeptidase [Caerostris extrusa]